MIIKNPLYASSDQDYTYNILENGITQYIFDTETISDGSRLYQITDTYTDQDEVYNTGAEVYKESNIYKVVPSIMQTIVQLTPDTNSLDQFCLVSELTDKDVTFVIFDYELDIDITKNPLSEITSYNNGQVLDIFYTNCQLLGEEQNRVRFVTSDFGRSLSFSVFDKDKKQYEHLNTFIFPQKVQNSVKIVFSIDNPNDIKDITANF